MKKIIAAVLASMAMLTLSAPVLAETYKIQMAGGWPWRDDHGTLARTRMAGDHEASGLYNPVAPETLVNSYVKLWPNTTYYCPLLVQISWVDPVKMEYGKLLADDRYFSVSFKKEGGGKQILKDVDVVLKSYDHGIWDPDGTVTRIETERGGFLRLVTGQNTTDEEFLFRLTGKFKVRENANLAALAPLEEFIGAELEPGDVIQVDMGRFVVGNRKKTGTDKDWEAGAYAAVWDPSDADRNTLLYETEAGTLMEIRLKADTSPDLIYLKLNTSWKPLEEAGLIPEQAFPKGDAVVYTFEDSNNLLSATSRADIYIPGHPDTALGGESMTDLLESGKLYAYSASINKDGTVSLTDISNTVSVGVVDGEKVLRLRDRALTNIILSTQPYAPEN